MTGEHEHRDDEEQAEFEGIERPEENEPLEDMDDDGAFVLEDWDELDQAIAEVEEAGTGEVTLDDDADDEQYFVVDDQDDEVSFDSPEDLLFEPTGQPTGETSFSEDSTHGWSGDPMDAESIGIPIEQQGAADDFDQGIDSDSDPIYGGGTPGEAGESDLDLAAPSGFEFRAQGDEELGDEEFGEVDLDESADLDFQGESGFFRAEGPESGGWQSAAEPPSESGSAFTATTHELPSESLDFGEPATAGQHVDAHDAETAEFGEAEEFDPIYGESGSSESESGGFMVDQYGFGDEDESSAHHELDPEDMDHGDSYAESDWSPTEAVPRRRFPVRAVGSLAALLLIGAGATAVWTKPEWFGIAPSAVIVDRADVARPSVNTALKPPSAVLPGQAVPEVAQVEPEPVQPTDVETPIDVTTDPIEVAQQTPVTPEPTEVTPDPTPTIDPGSVAAAPSESLVIIDGGTTTETEAAPEPDLIAIGEELSVGDRYTPEVSQANPMSAGLMSGDQAFAQLENGNYFVGNVKTINRGDITLRLRGGEVTLGYESLRGLGTVNSDEYRELMQTETGFIRLNNENRFAGTIVRQAGNIVVGVDENRIVIPESEIIEIADNAPAEIRVEEEEDDAWIRQLIRQREQKRAQKLLEQPAAPQEDTGK